MLRLFQAGVSIADLREMTVGMAIDLLTEESNDLSNQDQNSEREATQADIDMLKG